MKINKQDEYGIRILLRIARSKSDAGLSIPQLSELEGMSQPYVGKIARMLRIAGFVESTRGQKGGYVLAQDPKEIIIKDVISSLGGNLFTKDFCGQHSGEIKFCTNSVDCSVRSLWTILQYTVDKVLANISLFDLIGNENNAKNKLDEIIATQLNLEVVPS
ncbi:MAG: Rrf2 family transcriptional regulator [Saprospiraceae bacterium]|nr:Rrf2 family transcriptional regulator [Saprospiraceae bacterium]